MTPASALSRLEKLAKERRESKRVNGVSSSEVEDDFLEGGKALLQILSEPGEACGPRVTLTHAKLVGPQVFVCIDELLQARAEIARYHETISLLDKSLDEKCVEIQLGKAALASSEARVRILSEELEKIAEPMPGAPPFYAAEVRRKFAVNALAKVKP